MSYNLQTADDLLVDIKANSYIASSQGNYSDAQLLAVADRMILQKVVPLLKSLDSDWYRSYVDVPLSSTSDLVAIPRYAMYGMIYRVALISSTDGRELASLGWFVNSDTQLYRTATSGTPNAFELMHNQLRFDRTPRASDVTNYKIRVYFYRRPGRLVTVANSARVLSVNTVSGVVTYTAAPPATFTATAIMDFYRPPYPFVRVDANVKASAAAGSTQTFPILDATQILAGDCATLEDETIYPDVPIEMIPFVSDLVALKIARSKGDSAQIQIDTQDTMESMRNALMSAPADRVKGVKRKLSLLNSGLVSSGRRRFMVND